MVEGNSRGQFVWQMPRQKGFLEEANAILRRLRLPEIDEVAYVRFASVYREFRDLNSFMEELSTLIHKK